MKVRAVQLDELDSACAELDRLEDAANKQAELLAERRQALITGVVAGRAELPIAV